MEIVKNSAGIWSCGSNARTLLKSGGKTPVLSFCATTDIIALAGGTKALIS